MDDWGFPWVKEAGCRKAPASDRVFEVNDFGAVGDGVAISTAAIQRALDEAEKQGGGVVRLSPGIYRSGSLFIGNNTTFDIPKGSVLRGLNDIAAYPVIKTRVAGFEIEWPAALINIIDKQCSAITGEGIIDGDGKVFWDDFWEKTNNYYTPNGLRWASDYDCRRPRGILIQNCSDIRVDGVVIFRAGFWSLHILYSHHVTAENICIANNIGGRGPSTDGIDIDSSEYVLVQNSRIDCNDDNFCLKAGRDADGLRVNRPTRYVLLRNCRADRGCGLVTFGSETSGSISDILVENMTAHHTGVGMKFKSGLTRGGYVRDIYIRNVNLSEVGKVIDFDLNWFPESMVKLPESFLGKPIPEHWKVMTRPVIPPERGIPVFSDLHFRDITGDKCRIALSGNASTQIPLRNLTFERCRISAKESGNAGHAENVRFIDSELIGEDGSRQTE